MQKDHFEQLEQKEMRIQAEAAEEETLRFVHIVILWVIDYYSLKYQFSKLFRQQMLAKFAEDDRIELMNAQKRRMKVSLFILFHQI